MRGAEEMVEDKLVTVTGDCGLEVSRSSCVNVTVTDEAKREKANELEWQLPPRHDDHRGPWQPRKVGTLCA